MLPPAAFVFKNSAPFAGLLFCRIAPAKIRLATVAAPLLGVFPKSGAAFLVMFALVSMEVSAVSFGYKLYIQVFSYS